MREILFRVFDKTKNEMHHFEYVETKGDNFDLMQSTGMKDKNGKDIFEGDIVTSGVDGLQGRNIAVVKYGEAQAFNGCCEFSNMVGFYLDSLVIDKITKTSCTHLCPELELTVLGNVNENPDLLRL